MVPAAAGGRSSQARQPLEALAQQRFDRRGRQGLPGGPQGLLRMRLAVTQVGQGREHVVEIGVPAFRLDDFPFARFGGRV